MFETLNLPPEIQAAVIDELKKGQLLNQVAAEHNVHTIGQLNQMEARSLEGLGQKKASIDAESYHFWGQKLGYQCWSDKQFLNEYLRDNPYARAKSTGTKLQVGYYPSSRRKVKSYG